MLYPLSYEGGGAQGTCQRSPASPRAYRWSPAGGTAAVERTGGTRGRSPGGSWGVAIAAQRQPAIPEASAAAPSTLPRSTAR
jgi:hypothetical protein